MENYLINFLAICLLFILSGCLSTADIMRDASNPCTQNQPYTNSEECEYWKERYPREYRNYIKRVVLSGRYDVTIQDCKCQVTFKKEVCQ